MDTAVHIPGKENTVADYMSSSLSDNTEWQLKPIIFKNIIHIFNFVPELDLLDIFECPSSVLCIMVSLVPCYVSWFP